MAVDTAAKRFSMLNFGDGTTIHLLFAADGSVDLGDRQHMLDCYSGIAFDALVVVVVTPVQKFIVDPGVVRFNTRGGGTLFDVPAGAVKFVLR